jgi:hypothetical protein
MSVDRPFLHLRMEIADEHIVGFGVPAECSQLPAHLKLVNETYILPDPFKFIDGRRTNNKADWACRAAQVRALVQEYELRYKPTQPKLLNSTIQFSLPITYPTTETAPYPVIIAYSGLSIPVPLGVAVITFDNSEMGQHNDQSSRGVRLFYDLYSLNATASSMMA